MDCFVHLRVLFIMTKLNFAIIKWCKPEEDIKGWYFITQACTLFTNHQQYSLTSHFVEKQYAVSSFVPLKIFGPSTNKRKSGFGQNGFGGLTETVSDSPMMSFDFVSFLQSNLSVVWMHMSPMVCQLPVVTVVFALITYLKES